MKKDELRNKIAERKLKEETIHVDEWDTDLVLKEMNGKRFVFLSEQCTHKGKMDQKKFLTYAIIDTLYTTVEDGDEKLYSMKDFDEVDNLPAGIYNELLTSVILLNDFLANVGDSNPKN